MTTNATETDQKDVVLNWTVTQQYWRQFSPEFWAELVSSLDPDLDPFDLDAVYSRLEQQDWKVEDLLAELATDKYWVDTTDAEATDLEFAKD